MLYLSIIERSVLMALAFNCKDMLEKKKRSKETSNSQFLSVTESTQLNAAHAQLVEKLRPIAFAETCRFLTIQSL